MVNAETWSEARMEKTPSRVIHKNLYKLLYSPIEDFYQTKIRQEPLGLNYLYILGEHHASAIPRELAQAPDVDYIVIGEAEFTFLKLIEGLSTNPFEQLNSV